MAEASPPSPAAVSPLEHQESPSQASGQHVCGGCEDQFSATSFCFQCDMKLCDTCVDLHNKFPAMKQHLVDSLDNVSSDHSPDDIISSRCKTTGHEHRQAEAYCSAHHQLICMSCASANHGSCHGVRAVREAGSKKRSEVKQEARRLREKEAVLRSMVEQYREKFAAMRVEAEQIFTQFASRVDRRRQEVDDMIVAEQATFDLPSVERVAAAILSQVETLDSVVDTASDAALLDMSQGLTSRLGSLHDQHRALLTARAQGPAGLQFDSYLLHRLESGIAALGRLQPATAVRPSAPSIETAIEGSDNDNDNDDQSESSYSSCSSSRPHSPTISQAEPPPPPYSSRLPQPRCHPSAPPTSSSSPHASPPSTPEVSGPPPPYSAVVSRSRSPPSQHPESLMSSLPAVRGASASSRNNAQPKPSGPYLAAVLKRGDRVKRSADLWPRVEGSGGQGTVSSIPSQLRQARGEDPSGCVDVRWDSGEELCHWMGRFGRYELELL